MDSRKNVTSCFASIVFACLFLSTSLGAQEPEEPPDSLHFEFSPDSLYLDVGDEVEVEIRVMDEDGQVHPTPFFLYSRGQDRQARRALKVTPRRSGPGD